MDSKQLKSFLRIVTFCTYSLLAQNLLAGAVYYVSTTGNDSNDGLTPATAWASIDNGDQNALGVLIAGDTVLIASGNYTYQDGFAFETNGTAADRIVYLGDHAGLTLIDFQNSSAPGITINGSHVEIRYLTITNVNDHGIQLDGDSCLIDRCLIYGVSKIGIRVNGGKYSVIQRNVIYNVGDRGIKNEDAGKEQNSYFNNTIFLCGNTGIELGGKVKSARLLNNIVAANGGSGIKGPVESICAFNNVWGNPSGDYDGVVDSAGGISVQPRFVDEDGLRFDLKINSDEIDAGLDIGLRYSGSAPDIGAFEKYNTYYVSLLGNNQNHGFHRDSSWLSVDNDNGLLRPGDTVHVLPGVYTDSIILINSGLTDDDICYIADIDSVILDGIGLTTMITMTGNHNCFSGFNVINASTNMEITGDHVHILNSEFSNALQYGVLITSGLHSEIIRSVFVGNGYSGITSTTDSIHIINCTFHDNAQYGVDAIGMIGSEIINSIFSAESQAPTGIRCASDNSLLYSYFHNQSPTVNGGIKLGVGCAVVDPEFVDVGSANFHLKSTSNAIDYGIDVGQPFIGVAPDLGVYETGLLSSIEIVPVFDTISADTAYQFSVISLDSDGYPAAMGLLSWGKTFTTGIISSEGLFVPDLVGQGAITVQSSLNGVVDTSQTMTLIAGEMNSLLVTPNGGTVSADSTIQFTAQASDQNGNVVGDPGSLIWSVVGDIGSIDNNGLYSPGHIGQGFVRVESGLGPQVITDTIFVQPGALAILDLLPDNDVVTQGDSRQYNANGYDSDSNFVKILTDSINWSTNDPTGSINVTGFYTAGSTVSPPEYVIIGTYDGMLDTSMVTVISNGSLARISIEYANGTPFAGGSFTTDNDTTVLYARGYDAGDSLLGNVSVTWNLGGADSIGYLSSATGTNTQITLTSLGGGIIIADYDGSLIDSSAVMTVYSGSANHIIITPNTITMPSDSAATFSIETYDADNNIAAIGSVPSWSVLGDIATISNLGLLTPTAVGTCQVISDAGAIIDTTGIITIVPSGISRIEILPDSIVVSSDSVYQFEVLGYDAQGFLRDEGNISWSLIGSIGSIDANGLFTATSVGVGQIIAISDLGVVDTSVYLEVSPGRLVTITIDPDNVSAISGDEISFRATGVDSDGNPTNVGGLNWEVIGGIGEISSNGDFLANLAGTGLIVVTSSIDGITDTTSTITVVVDQLARLAITPDVATLDISDSVQFSLLGFDSHFNPVPVGEISWSTLGSIGLIDSLGKFIAIAPGIGRMVAISDLNGIADTSGEITVQSIVVSALPIGNQLVHPGDDSLSILSLKIMNLYEEDKQIDGITLRDMTFGPGSEFELASNVDSIFLYADIDQDSILSPADLLLGVTAMTGSINQILFSPYLIGAGQENCFFVTANISLFARDGDSVDLAVLPVSDISVVDSSPVAGADTVNSIGRLIVDGLVSSQIIVGAQTADTLTTSDILYNVLSLDIPRNGYSSDTLSLFSVILDNNFSVYVDEYDIDSLVLFLDDGDGLWSGAGAETKLGNLAFTGSRWIRSGLMIALTDSLTTFHVAVALSDFPTNNAELRLIVPVNGIEMNSANDGPIDQAISNTPTAIIITEERVQATVLPLGSQIVVPGRVSPTLLSIIVDNSFFQPFNLDSLTARVVMIDPFVATVEQLDSQLDSLILFLELDGDTNTFGPGDSLIATAFVQNGLAKFITPAFVLAGNGGDWQLSVVAAMNLLNSHDGNSIEVKIQSASSFYFNPVVNPLGEFPLQNDAPSVIDGFSSEAVAVHPIPQKTIFGGQVNQAVFSFTLPQNGYADDDLRKITLKNIGSLAKTGALNSIKLWFDRGPDGFDNSDSLFAELLLVGDLLVADNLAVLIPNGGKKIIVTVDVSTNQFEAGTLQLEIPVEGVRYWRGMDGPDDIPVGQSAIHFVFPTDRVTAISISEPDQIIYPGQGETSILGLALYNGYVSLDTLILDGLTFTNTTYSASGADWADSSLSRISLYFDADKNRLFSDGDSLLGAGYFVDQHLRINGFGLILPTEDISYFFVTCDLSNNLIDGDSLSVILAEASDLIFDSGLSISVNGDLPLERVGKLIVDGSVSNQYEFFAPPARTLRPGDSEVIIMDVKIASNGNLIDTLVAIRTFNEGTADGSDIAQLHFWQDGNDDDIWQVTDNYMGQFTQDVAWTMTGLTIPVDRNSASFFVTANLSLTATPGRTLHFSLSTGSVQYRSDNDGPLDNALTHGTTLEISSSGLSLTLNDYSRNISVGQESSLAVSIKNVGSVSLSDVTLAASFNTSTAITVDSIRGGSPLLAAGDSVTVLLFATGTNVGEDVWSLQAVSSGGDSSAVIISDLVQVQTAIGSITPEFVNTIPASVIRGQANVYPLSLLVGHPATNGSVASLQVDSIRITIEDGSGAGIIASDLFSRVVLTSGTSNLTVLDILPDDSLIMIPLAQSLVVSPGEESNLSLLVDLDSVTSALEFRLAIKSEADIFVTDLNTGQQLLINPLVSFPMQTATCRIDLPAPDIWVADSKVLQPLINYGQESVPSLRLLFTHPGTLGSSQAQITSVTLSLVDSLLSPLATSLLVNRISLLRGQLIVAEKLSFSPGTAPIEMPLNSPITLNAGEIDSLTVQLSVNTLSPIGGFGVMIADSTDLTVRDLSSGSLVTVTTDTTRLATGSIFPIYSGYASLKRAALPAEICLSSTLPTTLAGGRDSLELVSLDVNYTASVDFSPVRLSSVMVGVYDSLFRSLDPDRLFDRIGYKVAGGATTYLPFVQVTSGRVLFQFGDSGIVIQPSETIQLSLVADIEADVPFDHFQLMVQSADDFNLSDATDPTFSPGLLTPLACPSQLPFATSVADIFLPAGRPVLDMPLSGVRIVHKGEQGVIVNELNLSYNDEQPLGDLQLDALYGEFYQRGSNGINKISPQTLFDRLSLEVDGSIVAVDSSLSSDTLMLDIGAGAILSRGANMQVKLIGDLKDDAPVGNYYFKIPDSSYIKLSDQNLAVSVFALTSLSYPIVSSELSLLEAELSGSFVNFPNPFLPANGGYTTIGFTLSETARVDIEMFTITGQHVKEIVLDQTREMGSYAEDRWYAENDRGLAVAAGTYYCRITARYISGRIESFRRKVAVVR